LSDDGIDRCTQAALELTERLCRQPSVSAEGRALDETADLVAELLGDVGFTTRRWIVPGAAPAVYGEQVGEHPYTLLLYNHYDVQPADPIELWDSPPFEPTMRDGRLYARGTADNKGEIGVRLAAIRAVLEQHGRLPFTVRWIIEGEEEIGSPHFEQLARDHAPLLQADACFWEGSVSHGDGRPVITLGYKGALGVRLSVQALSSDAHSGLAALLPSAAWRLTEALSLIRAPDGTVRIPGFYDDVRPPTDADRKAIGDQGPAMLESLRAGYGPASFVDQLDGDAARERFSFGPTCNIAGIQSGYTGPGLKTVLPREAAAQIDFRLVCDQDPDRILTALRDHLDSFGYQDIELSRLMSARPVRTDLDDPLVERVAAIAERAFGARAKFLPSSPATQPVLGTLQRHVGVTGLAAPDNPPHQASAIHAPNEHIRLEDLRRVVSFCLAAFQHLHETPPADPGRLQL
jgi:acetylornithine deacetylase/succinyl-diaminopimelate desuccinylase-like protein